MLPIMLMTLIFSISLIALGTWKKSQKNRKEARDKRCHWRRTLPVARAQGTSPLLSFPQKAPKRKTGPAREGELSPTPNSAQKTWFWYWRSHLGIFFPPIFKLCFVSQKNPGVGKIGFWEWKRALPNMVAEVKFPWIMKWGLKLLF